MIRRLADLGPALVPLLHRLDVTGGILEVQPHMVTVMADTALRGEDLDAAAAKAAKAEAERELADRTGEMEIAEAQAKLLEAAAQLRALERLRKSIRS